MTRVELILRTRQLIAEGERLESDPSLKAMRVWLQLSDDLLSTAWGSMDRYHLAWLLVGKSKDVVRGRPMSSAEESDYVRDVATQKTAALRMSLDAVERQHMPFVGESGPAADRRVPEPAVDQGGSIDRAPDRAPDRAGLPTDPSLAQRLEDARARDESGREDDEPRAPRPDRMQR